MANVRNPNYYGYIIAAACFSIQAISIGTRVSYGVFFNPLIEEFGWSRATVSGAFSAGFLIMGFSSIFVGRLIDKTGPRNVMTATGLLFGLGHLLMSRLGSVWQLYLFYGVLTGIGLCSADVITLSTTARWFSSKRGLMTAVVKIGTGVGQLIIPLAASFLILSYGWRTSYIIVGSGLLLLLLPIAQFLKFPPEQIDPMADYKRETSPFIQYPSDEGLSLNEIYRTRQFWTICAATFSIFFCLQVIIIHIIPHVRDIGIYPTKAASIVSLIGAVSMAGRFFTGILIDRIGGKKAITLCFIFLIAGLLWLQIAKELWMFYLFALIYGLAHGGFFTAISPIVAEFFGIGAHGLLFGTVLFSGTIGGSIGPVLAGYIFDETAKYNLAFWLCLLISIIGLTLFLLLKPMEKRGRTEKIFGSVALS